MSWYEIEALVAFVFGILVLMVTVHPKCCSCGSKLTYTTRGETTDDFSGHPRTFTPFTRYCFRCKHEESGFEIRAKTNRT
jgi:hypothetical protein